MFDPARRLLRDALEPLRRAKPVSAEQALRQGRIYSRSVEGVRANWLVTNPGDEIQSYQLRDGYYELAELLKLRSDVGSRSSVLDIGANIGNHAVFFLKHMGCSRLTVVEPFPAAMQHLLANMSLNYHPHVQLRALPIAFGATSGSGTIIAPPCFNVGLTRINNNTSGDVTINAGDIALGGNYPVDLIKIDVEGMELEVLEGLVETLTRDSPAIYVEVSTRTRSRALEFLNSLGYRVVRESEAYSDQFNITAVHD
jgi:FkbM family methyltransferase